MIKNLYNDAKNIRDKDPAAMNIFYVMKKIKIVISILEKKLMEGINLY